MTRGMKQGLRSVAALLASLPLWMTDAAASCVRHFYNKSDVAWSVTFSGRQGCILPGRGGQSYCTIPPGQTATLVYEGFSGSIAISSVYYSATFTLSADCGPNMRCTVCYIEHSGNTGRIVVNDPAEGDVVTCGGQGYPCR